MLISSQKLKDIFEISLAIGNYLNGTSARGGAYGFSLSNFKLITKKFHLKNLTTLK
jgi:hypothetical protein